MMTGKRSWSSPRGRVDFAIIGPEDPLNNGIVDFLKKEGIPSVGPTKSLARLETSKTFTRNLLEKYDIRGNPLFRTFFFSRWDRRIYRRA